MSSNKKEIIKPSLLRQYYLTFVRLYGVIYFDDAHMIIKKYHPSFLKKDLRKDLNPRLFIYGRGYAVAKTKNNKFIIFNPIFTYEDIDRLFLAQGNKPFFVCPNEEEYLKYQDPDYDDNEELYDKLEKFLLKNGFSKQQAITICYTTKINIATQAKMQTLADTFESLNIDFGNEEVFADYMGYYQELNNNTRIPSNRGFTPLEIANHNTSMVELFKRFKDSLEQEFLDENLDAYAFKTAIKQDPELTFEDRQEMLEYIDNIIEKMESLKA